MKKQWLAIGLKFIPWVGAIISAGEQIKNAKGPEKKQRVLDAVQLGISATEFALERDVLNDPAVVEALSNYMDAYVRVQNAIALTKQMKAAPGGGGQ